MPDFPFLEGFTGPRGPFSGIPVILNPELEGNGTFDVDLTGWTQEAGASVAVVDGQAVMTVDGGNNRGFGSSYSTEIGEDYTVLWDFGDGSIVQPAIRIGAALGAGAVLNATYAKDASHSVTFTAADATTWITFRPNSTTNGDTAIVDNVSVKRAT